MRSQRGDLVVALLFQSLLGFEICHAQSPECVANRRLLHDAASLISLGAHKEAFAAYDAAFAHAEYALWYRIEATEAALAQGDTARAIRYLHGLYARGGQPLLTYSDPIKGMLAQGFRGPELGYLETGMAEWAAEADSIWIGALQEMHALDQSHRDDDALTRTNDSLNLERLIVLIEQRGFPTVRHVGNSFGIVTLLHWHHRGELGKNARLSHFEKLAQTAMDACKIEPDFLAGSIDYEAWEKGEPTPYGTLINYFRNDLSGLHLPNLETLNANRAGIGLGPIENFARAMDIPFDALPIGR